MYVLGINAYHADVSAVLLKNGEVIAAVEEERFRRIKHWAGFPSLAIQKCLEIAGVSGSAVEHVGISRNPRAHLPRKAWHVLRHAPEARAVLDRARNSVRLGGLKQELAEALGVPEDRVPRMHFIEHHPTHLASAFFVSPFAKATVCAIDGFGDFVSTSVALGTGNRLDVKRRVFFPHSLGMMYTAVTQHLGFLGFGDEFKVMGLAPYGEPEPDLVRELSRMVRLLPDGKFELDLRYFRHASHHIPMEWESGYPTLAKVCAPELAELIDPARQPTDELTPRHENIARSLQEVYERCLFHVLRGAWELTREPQLCLAGGCAMNSVANGKIRDNTPFTDLYVQPASADNGTALGAAVYVWNQILGNPRSFVMSHGYWGTSYPNADVPALVRARVADMDGFSEQTFASEDALCREVAGLIADGNIVGWYQGRMEWGARALGNRSILADPRRSDIRDIINLKIKFREKFRPFAPSILVEHVDEYFEGACEDPFMLQVYPIRAAKRELLPAVTHVDGSGRLQTVSAKGNPRYYRLISAFKDLSGVPIVLNTSFNENEPIVDTPEQALDCFLRTKMDVLVVNNTVIRRKGNGEREVTSLEA